MICVKHHQFSFTKIVSNEFDENREKPVTWSALLLPGIKCRRWKINAKYIQIMRLHTSDQNNLKPKQKSWGHQS